MEQRAFCILEGLKGVKRHRVDGYLITEAEESYIKKTLENGNACVAAGDNGSLNIWKTDTGVIKGEVMRIWHTLEEKSFFSYAEVVIWANKWIDYIRNNITMPANTPIDTSLIKPSLTQYSDQELRDELKRREKERHSKFPPSVRCFDCKHCTEGFTFKHQVIPTTICRMKPKPSQGPERYYVTTRTHRACEKYEPK